MATLAETLESTGAGHDALSGTPRAHAIDRWIFVITAAWFIIIILTGFVPDSARIIGAVQAGHRPPFPLVMHVHAVLMGSFLSLLLAQAWLMATGRSELHMRLGVVSFLLVPALVGVGVVLAFTMYHQIWESFQAAKPGPARLAFQAALAGSENAKLVQIRTGLLFPALVGVALAARRNDAGLHKRMMFLATAVSLPAGINRMAWLPSTLPASFVTSDLYVLLGVSPLFVWDVLRNHRIHRAYWIWLAAFLPASVLLNTLWDTPWWHATARHLMGV